MRVITNLFVKIKAGTGAAELRSANPGTPSANPVMGAANTKSLFAERKGRFVDKCNTADWPSGRQTVHLSCINVFSMAKMNLANIVFIARQLDWAIHPLLAKTNILI